MAKGFMIILYFSLCLLLYIFIKFLQKVWWTPLQTQHMLMSQGLKGPFYRFIYGNSKEMLKMKEESMKTPMGLSHNTLPKIYPYVCTWLKAYGMNFVCWHGMKAQLVVTEVELVKEILKNKERAFPKMEFEGYVKKLLGDGLFSSDGQKWEKQRKLAHQAFHAESLKNMSGAMVSSVEGMMERWEKYEGKEVEVHEEFRLLTSEIISRTAFGSSYLEGKDIFDMLMMLAYLLEKNIYKTKLPGLSRIFRSKDEKESDKLEQGIKDSVVEMMKKREKATNGESNEYGDDFLGLLMKAHNDVDEGRRITVDDVVDECKTFYLAGHETTTSLLSWATFLLAIHTDWQDKAREEVFSLFGDQNPNSEGIARLKTMNMIINETLRLYPPVISLVRKVSREVKLGKLTLPAGVDIHIPLLAIHHDTGIWGADALHFNPERFAGGVAQATGNNSAIFLPFGLGPRSCVGLNFATNEAKIALSMILQRYSFTLSPTYTHSPTQVLTVHPKHGVQVTIHAVKST